MVCDIWNDKFSGFFPSHVLQNNTLSFVDSLFWKKQAWRRGPILLPKRSALYWNAHDCKHQTVYGFKSLQRLMNLRWCMFRNMYVYVQLQRSEHACASSYARLDASWNEYAAYTCFSHFYVYLSYSYKCKHYIIKHNSVNLMFIGPRITVIVEE